MSALRERSRSCRDEARVVKRDPGISPEKALPERSRERRLGGRGAPAGSAPWKRLSRRERDWRKGSEARTGAGSVPEYPAGSRETPATRWWEELGAVRQWRPQGKAVQGSWAKSHDARQEYGGMVAASTADFRDANAALSPGKVAGAAADTAGAAAACWSRSKSSSGRKRAAEAIDRPRGACGILVGVVEDGLSEWDRQWSVSC